MHKEDVGGGTALPLEAPGLVSVAGEERSRNRVNFFPALLFFFESWLHAGFRLGQSEWVPSARTPSAILPCVSLMAWPSRVCLSSQPWGH